MGPLAPMEIVMFVGMLLVQVGIPLAAVAGGLWVFSKTPFGRALVERIRGGGQDALLVQQLADEVATLREELTTVQERLDFAERRLIAREASEISGEH